MPDYRLEGRYLVIKLDRLDYDDSKALRKFLEDYEIGYAQVSGVVIEEDWPEYTPVCDMLFGRIDREASAN